MKFFYCLLSLLLIFQWNYSQKFVVENPPKWVKDVEIPKTSSISKYEVSSGFYCSLLDNQYNLDQDEFYSHEVINVFSYTGITKASQILISYDTSYQKLKIHHLYIWRKGERIDRTKDLSFERMNNEYNLGNGIYMGRITAYDNLNDIRKDDLIDLAYTLKGKNPIFENQKYSFIPLASVSSMDYYRNRLIFSKNNSYNYKCVDCDSFINFSDSINGDFREIEISSKNLKAFDFENNIPSWVIPYNYFILSSYKSWSEVGLWANKIFQLKQEPDLEPVFKEIFKGNETMDEKINKIVDFVQDDIRYMGIESGIGSIKPFAPDQVVKQRFGDCKDKSLLLVSLLKKIGISEAYPALVNTYMRQETERFLPSNQVFNHCIVTFNYNNKTYWIDPTFTQQGGDFTNMAIENYGKALIVGVVSDSLSVMIPQEFSSGANIVDEIFVTSFVNPAKLKITSKRYGYEADQRRYYLEQVSGDELSKRVADDLKSVFPRVEKSEDMKVVDDIKNNLITTTYSYDIDGFWQDGDKMNDQKSAGYWFFRYEPQSIYQYFNYTCSAKRKYDFYQAYPENLHYEVIIHFPKDLLINDSYYKVDNNAFYLDEKLEQLNINTVQITYNLKTKGPIIKAADFNSICDQKNKMIQGLPVIFYFNK